MRPHPFEEVVFRTHVPRLILKGKNQLRRRRVGGEASTPDTNRLIPGCIEQLPQPLKVRCQQLRGGMGEATQGCNVVFAARSQRGERFEELMDSMSLVSIADLLLNTAGGRLRLPKEVPLRFVCVGVELALADPRERAGNREEDGSLPQTSVGVITRNRTAPSSSAGRGFSVSSRNGRWRVASMTSPGREGSSESTEAREGISWSNEKE